VWTGSVVANIAKEGASQDEVAQSVLLAATAAMKTAKARLDTVKAEAETAGDKPGALRAADFRKALDQMGARGASPVEDPRKRTVIVEDGSNRLLAKMTDASVTGDAFNFPIEFVNIEPDQDLLIDNTAPYMHVGTPQQRCLFYAFETGADEIPVIFPTLKNLAGRFGGTALGFAVGDLQRVDGGVAPATHPRIKNSILLMSACVTAEQPYLFAHEIGHVMIGNSLHVPGDYEDDSKTDFYDALMSGSPGDEKPHYTIDGHEPQRDNYTALKFTADATFVKDAGQSNSPGRVRYNCVARILAHSHAVAP
jgi:hypothetical protein